MRNPCLDCNIHKLKIDKKFNQACRNCRSRIDYANSISGRIAPKQISVGQSSPIPPSRKAKAVAATPKKAGLNRRGQNPKAEKKQCSDCEKWFDPTPKNFAGSAKTEDGLMNICKGCHTRRCINGKTKKKAKVDRSAKVPTSKPLKKTFDPPANKDRQDNRPWLMLDLAGHEDLLDQIRQQAEQELRTPEMQALFLLRKSLNQ